MDAENAMILLNSNQQFSATDVRQIILSHVIITDLNHLDFNIHF